MGLIRVASSSKPSAVAGAIAGVIREAGQAEVQAVGAGAVNQAVKAIAVAVNYLTVDEIEITCVPTFVDVEIAGQICTGIRFTVEKR